MNQSDGANPSGSQAPDQEQPAPSSNARLSVQQQMAEYRKKMARRTSEPIQSETQPEAGVAQRANNNPFRDDPPVKNQRTETQVLATTDAENLQEQLIYDKQDKPNRMAASNDEYIPPALAFSPQSTQSPKGINQTDYRPSTSTNNPLISERPSLVNVQVTDLPIVNLYDLTRRSENYRKYKKGAINCPDDLESNIIVDDKLSESDLYLVEKEVRKANMKRLDDLRNNALIPATSRTSLNLNAQRQQRAQQQNRVQVDDGEARRADQMRQEQLIPGQERRRNRECSFMCGMLRRQANDRLDIFCLKDLDSDFVYMFLFVSTITACITLYAAF